MADYYSQTTLTQEVLLTEDLAKALSARGATLHAADDGETILDALVTGKLPRKLYGIVWQTGWTNVCDDVDEFLVEYAGWDEVDAEKASSELRGLVVLGEEDILHEILKINPDIDLLEMNEAWTCSKMRLDGFGGRSLMVNRKGYLYISTGRYHVDEDGVIEPDNAFRFWKDEQV